MPLETVTSPTTKPVTASEKVAVTVNGPEKVEEVAAKATVGAVVSIVEKFNVLVSVIPEKKLFDRSLIAVASI